MTIEIRNQELEAFLTERMQSGEFASIEEALLEALHLDVESLETQRPTRTPLEPSTATTDSDKGSDVGRNPSSERSVFKTAFQAATKPVNDLDAMFAEVRGLADDIDFSRIPFADRPVAL